ncbi:MAG TPA: hypothetical protein VGR31_01605 [Planctomycetota bacterium]|jgi:hypothetical protein|nr:hypothetical protein [Planctomycetota bacterium]
MARISGIVRVGWLLPWLAASTSARAQCPEWKSGFHVNGINRQVLALASFDDGSGPALYAGGRFGVANGVAVANIAKWDGSAWSPLGAGLTGGAAAAASAIASFDDGSGPALYVAGTFTQAGGVAANHIAKWDGTSWSPLAGTNGSIFEFIVFDDGSGPALYAGGVFSTAGGLPANNIAKWDGTAWSALGTGLESDMYPSVGALAVYDDGTGPALYAAGEFTTAGGAPATNIAKWDGVAWSPVGGGTDSRISALTVFDDGSGPVLVAAGLFSTAGGSPADQIGVWDGSNWSTLGNGIYGVMFDLEVYDDGSGPALYAGGNWSGGNLGAHGVAKWNGSDWEPLASGVGGEVDALAVFDDGSGAKLAVAGAFGSAGGLPANDVAGWNGSSWSVLGGGAGVNSTVFAMVPFDDGSGLALHVGGAFTRAGDTSPGCVAKWNGSSWTPLGSGVDAPYPATPVVRAVRVFDDGSGPALYAAGFFVTAGGSPAQHIAKWDGGAWSPLGSGIGNPNGSRVSALAVYDDGSGLALYASGLFTTAGGVPANYVARWNGSTWSALGEGITGMASHTWVDALAVFDDGSGPALYAAGSFDTAGGVPAANIAKWNGHSWSPLGSGLSQDALSLAVFDDGSGPALYAGGWFTAAGGTTAQHIARWNGSAWSRLGPGLTGTYGQVSVMTAFDDGSGPALYAGGIFTNSGGTPLNAIAKWDGSNWSSLGSGMGGEIGMTPHVFALASFDDGSGPTLYSGGIFVQSGPEYANFIAAWAGCSGQGTGVPFCFGDGTGAACPCANSGQAGHGCENSASTGGARLAGTGMASLGLDTVQLTASGELSSALSVFLQGDRDLATSVLFGDGRRCAGGTLKRLYVKNAVGGTVVGPTGVELAVSARSAALGDRILAGETRSYQVYYRDASATFCPSPPGGTFNASQALRILWGP